MAFVLVTAIAGTAVVLPFFLMGQRPESSKNRMMLLDTHDLGMHVPQAMELGRSKKAGVIYPRWLANINHGYGIATMIYYPPVFFHMLAFFNIFLGDWVVSVFVVTALSFIISALAFYKLSREFYGKLASAAGAFFYMFFPYHILDLYWRGAVPEVMGFALLPIVVYFAFKLGTENRPGYFAGLGLFYSLYLLTNMPVGYMLTYALAFYAVIAAIRKKDLRIVFRIGVAMSIGLLLSAIYWLPAALETKHVYEWATDLLPYHKTYITLLPTNDIFEQMINDSFGAIGLVIILALVIPRLIRTSNRFADSAEDRAPAFQTLTHTHLWLIMAIFSLFMCSSFSRYVSMLIPRIQISTPAWRWLVIASMFAALLIASAIDRLKSAEGLSRKKFWAFNAALWLVIAGTIWYAARYPIAEALAKPSFEPNPNYVDSGFTPKGATAPHSLPDTARVVVTPEGGTIGNIIWEPEFRQVELKVNEPSEVRLKTYNFPGWTARLDGQVVPMLSDKDGAQVIKVPPGLHKIEASFESTPPRIIGATVAGIGFVCVLAFAVADILMQRRRRRASLPAQTGFAGEYEQSLLPGDESRSKRLAFLDKKAVRVAAVVIAVAAIALAVILSRSSREGKPGEATTTTGSAAGARSAGGSEVRLFVESLDAIPLATDERALDELIGALAARDGNKVDALRESGRVINIVRGTKVEIIERGSGKAKVKIIEGEQLAREGWVPDRWLR